MGVRTPAHPGTGPFSVVVAGTATPLPTEAVGSGSERRIRFFATSVPSIGYRLYDIRDVAPASALADTARFDGGVLITSRYRIVMDGRGAIQRTTSIETDVAADDPVAVPDPAALRGNQIGTFRIRLP